MIPVGQRNRISMISANASRALFTRMPLVQGRLTGMFLLPLIRLLKCACVSCRKSAQHWNSCRKWLRRSNSENILLKRLKTLSPQLLAGIYNYLATKQSRTYPANPHPWFKICSNMKSNPGSALTLLVGLFGPCEFFFLALCERSHTQSQGRDIAR